MKIASFFTTLFVSVLTHAHAAAAVAVSASAAETDTDPTATATASYLSTTTVATAAPPLLIPLPQYESCEHYGPTGKSGKGMSMSKSGKVLRTSKSSKANSKLGGEPIWGIQITLIENTETLATHRVENVRGTHCMGEVKEFLSARLGQDLLEWYAGVQTTSGWFQINNNVSIDDLWTDGFLFSGVTETFELHVFDPSDPVLR